MGERIAVLGAGAWGLTLADLLAEKSNDVVVWDRTASKLDRLRSDRTVPALKGFRLHEGIAFEADMESAIKPAHVIVAAVPSFAVRALCEFLRGRRGGIGTRVFVNTSKGIEEESLLLPNGVFAQVLGGESISRYAVLSGPSHAEEVCRRIPSMVVAGAINEGVAEEVRDLFMQPSFRVYTQTDCVGVELGGALKNVIAIAAGVCDGLGFGDNSKAALVTRGIAEIARAAKALKANPETLSGLSGLGDLVVTAMSRHSRNRAFGELLGQGIPAEDALARVGAVVEGYRTARSAHELGAKVGVELPVVDAVYALLYKDASVHEVVRGLLERMPKPELA